MTDSTTPTGTAAGQLPVLQAAWHAVAAHPDLPALSVTVVPGSRTLHLDLHDQPVQAWEAWRAALGLPAETAEIRQRGHAWITATGTWDGVRVELTGHRVPPVPVVTRTWVLSRGVRQVSGYSDLDVAMAEGARVAGRGVHSDLRWKWSADRYALVAVGDDRERLTDWEIVEFVEYHTSDGVAL